MITVLGVLTVAALLILKHLFIWSPIRPSDHYRNRPLFFAHRGLLHLAPENTKPAFTAAIDEGFKAIEYDVVRTKDGVVVCSHNFDLERKTSGTGWIKDKTWEELKSITTGSSENKTGLTTLEEALESIPAGTLQNIEVKTARIFDIATAVSALKTVKRYKRQNDVIISSFNPFTLLAVKLVAPDIRTGFILETMDYFFMVNWIHPDFIHPTAELVNKKLLKFARDRELGFNVWTVNNRGSIQHFLRQGVDGIITDRHELHPENTQYDLGAYGPSVKKNVPLHKIRKIRHLVLREGLPYSSTRWEKDRDKTTSHYGLYINDQPVSIGTTIINKCPEFPARHAVQIRGMATLPDMQSKGYGTRILEKIIEDARDKGTAEILWANIRVSATGFYRKLGFKIISEEFSVPDIGPHRRGLLELY